MDTNWETPVITINGKTHVTTYYLVKPLPFQVTGHWESNYTSTGFDFKAKGKVFMVPFCNIIAVTHEEKS